MNRWIFWTGRTYTLTIVNGAKWKKSRVDSSLWQFFLQLFSFCKQSIMSPCWEFLVDNCFQFLLVGWENFFQLLILGDWGTQKKYPPTTIYFLSLVDKNWSHGYMWLCSQKEKNVVDQIHFFFLQHPNFWVCISAPFRNFSPSVFQGGGLLQALQALQVWLHLRNKSSTKIFLFTGFS